MKRAEFKIENLELRIVEPSAYEVQKRRGAFGL
jgi:hypothetical protein